VTSGTLLMPYSGVSDSADTNQTLLTLLFKRQCFK
jgi:hypothetical protein